MWRRAPLIEVPEDVSSIELIRLLGDFDVVIVDVDNTLVADRASAPALAAALAEARRAASQAGIDRLLVASNGSRTRAVEGDDVIWQLNKPWTRASRLGISDRDSVAVIGDRALPDGLLALRLGADFYLLSFHQTGTATGGEQRRAPGAWTWLFAKTSFDQRHGSNGGEPVG